MEQRWQRETSVSFTLERAMGIEPTSEAWEAMNKTLKAIDLAALNFLSDGLNWKLDGNRSGRFYQPTLTTNFSNKSGNPLLVQSYPQYLENIGFLHSTRVRLTFLLANGPVQHGSTNCPIIFNEDGRRGQQCSGFGARLWHLSGAEFLYLPGWRQTRNSAGQLDVKSSQASASVTTFWAYFQLRT
jgi:hypothetical protein